MRVRESPNSKALRGYDTAKVCPEFARFFLAPPHQPDVSLLNVI